MGGGGGSSVGLKKQVTGGGGGDGAGERCSVSQSETTSHRGVGGEPAL